MTTAPGTPSWLRERNDRTALEALFEHGPLTPEQMDEVLVRIKNYGKQPEEILDGTPPAMEPPPRRN